jgi:alkanesulfonate monooxygenase
MHPYAVAKMVACLALLRGRRTYLNMVAGGFKNDLTALDDRTPHDRRYDRLVEYGTVIARLLRERTPVRFEGEFYRVTNLRMTPALDAELQPRMFVSGSSDAGLAAAQALGAVAVQYPKPAGEYAAAPDAAVAGAVETGIRVGIISREDDDAAWAEAHARFPEDRKGELVRHLATKVSDSSWHRELSTRSDRDERDPYWLVPFRTYKSMCPYLVGSYATVGDALARYIALGHRTFILDIPRDPDDLLHTRAAFDHALETAKCHSYSTTG